MAAACLSAAEFATERGPCTDCLTPAKVGGMTSWSVELEPTLCLTLLVEGELKIPAPGSTADILAFILRVSFSCKEVGKLLGVAVDVAPAGDC